MKPNQIVSVRLSNLQVAYIDGLCREKNEFGNNRSEVIRKIVENKMKDTDRIDGTHWVSNSKNMGAVSNNVDLIEFSSKRDNNRCVSGITATTSTHRNPYVRRDPVGEGGLVKKTASVNNTPSFKQKNIHKYKPLKAGKIGAGKEYHIEYLNGKKPSLPELLSGDCKVFPIRARKVR